MKNLSNFSKVLINKTKKVIMGTLLVFMMIGSMHSSLVFADSPSKKDLIDILRYRGELVEEICMLRAIVAERGVDYNFKTCINQALNDRIKNLEYVNYLLLDRSERACLIP